MGDIFLVACGSVDFLGLLATLGTGELLAAACVVSVGLGACGLSVVAGFSVAIAAGAGVLLDLSSPCLWRWVQQVVL